MMDFTDSELNDIKMGMPVKMSFRRRVVDTVRGFSQYFWKAVPQTDWTPEIDFKGRVAIVTGAGGGLGRAYALELGRRGAKVVVNDFGGARDGSGSGAAGPADMVVEEIKAMGSEAVANYDNVATPEGGQKIVKTALDAFGKVDILINNAGILRDKGILKMEPETWSAVLAVHLNGAYNVTRPAFEAMRQNGYGRIIMTTSAAGLYGNFGQTNYGAAKLGIAGLMNTCEHEGAKYNILANTIVPIAGTRLTASVMPPNVLEKLKPDYVAPMVAWLSSEQCTVSGKMMTAGAGYFSRAAIMEGPGVFFDADKEVTVDMIAEKIDQIMDMTGAIEYEAAMAQTTTALSHLKFD